MTLVVAMSDGSWRMATRRILLLLRNAHTSSFGDTPCEALEGILTATIVAALIDPSPSKMLAPHIAQPREDLNRFVKESVRLVTALPLHGNATVCKKCQRKAAFRSLRVIGVGDRATGGGLDRSSQLRLRKSNLGFALARVRRGCPVACARTMR